MLFLRAAEQSLERGEACVFFFSSLKEYGKSDSSEARTLTERRALMQVGRPWLLQKQEKRERRENQRSLPWPTYVTPQLYKKKKEKNMERKEGKEVEGEVRPGEGVFAQLIWRIDSIESQCKDVRLQLQLSEKNFPAQTLVRESSRTNTSPPLRLKGVLYSCLQPSLSKCQTEPRAAVTDYLLNVRTTENMTQRGLGLAGKTVLTLLEVSGYHFYVGNWYLCSTCSTVTKIRVRMLIKTQGVKCFICPHVQELIITVLTGQQHPNDHLEKTSSGEPERFFSPQHSL